MITEKKLGFGCMRLPMQGDTVDYAEFNRMIDAYFAHGFNYFDTAHGYISGKSETAIRDCLAARYPRERYILTNKLSDGFFDSEAEIRPLVAQQLACCGVDYFDYYLMHALSAGNYEKYKSCRAFETVLALKEEGKIRHLGISFHDKAEVLDRILTENPQIEVVQIQFNYADFEDPGVQSRLCYETCVKHGKDVVVMEPVKGGSLAQLPPEAAAAFDQLGTNSYASYAIRFAAGFPQVAVVLSGMSDLAQMMDNIGHMESFEPLQPDEFSAVAQAASRFHAIDLIPCTACRYCVDGCPQEIPIPDLFALRNAKTLYQSADHLPQRVDPAVAADCIACGGCEASCPQHLPIIQLLQSISDSVS